MRQAIDIALAVRSGQTTARAVLDETLAALKNHASPLIAAVSYTHLTLPTKLEV